MSLPKLRLVTPATILSAVRNVKSNDSFAASMPASLKKYIILKLDAGEPLSAYEIKYLVSILATLTEGQVELLKIRLLSNEISDQDRTSIAESFLDLLARNKLTEKPFFEEFRKKAKVKGIRESIEKIAHHIDGEVKQFDKTILSEKNPVEYLLALNRYGRESQFTIGQQNLAKIVIRERLHDSLFVLKFGELKNFVERACLSSPLEVWTELDRSLGYHLSKDTSSNMLTLLDENLGFMQLMRTAQSEKADIKTLPNIARLRAIVEKFNEALSMLSAEVPERGEYWRKHLKEFTRIELKTRNGVGWRAAVAFHIKNYVLVELGPEGNALHVYTKAGFDKVRDTNRWNDRTNTTQEFVPLTRSEGTIWHTPGWQDVFDEFLREVKSRSQNE